MFFYLFAEVERVRCNIRLIPDVYLFFRHQKSWICSPSGAGGLIQTPIIFKVADIGIFINFYWCKPVDEINF